LPDLLCQLPGELSYLFPPIFIVKTPQNQRGWLLINIPPARLMLEPSFSRLVIFPAFSIHHVHRLGEG
jgi:hypothetical protein